MHIAEGVLSPPVLAAGGALAAAGLAFGLRGLEERRLMTAAMLASAFFVASLVHVPLGPANAHLVLNGLLGVLIGRAAFPAIFVALVLQAVLFQYGGFTVLGVNTFSMAFPAVACAWLFSPLLRGTETRRAIGAFCCGALSVAGAALLTALALAFTDEGFTRAAQVLFVAHLPVMAAEGLITALAVSFIARVRPEMLRFAGL